MKIGDLVEITHRAGKHYAGKVGVVTQHLPASMSAPYELLAVTFADGDYLSGITSTWVKVLNESG